MTGQPKYNTALYLRLSKDDGTMNESSSIQTQKEMLTRYCRENGFAISQIYIEIIIPSLIQRNGIIKKYALAV